MSQNVLVVHGGGPTAVINASLYGVIEEAKRNPEVGKVYGAIGGTGAIFSETFIDLTSFDDEKLKLLLHTPASAIGSSRYPLYEKDYEKMVDIFKKHDIKYVLLNGGNGTMDACGHIYEVCKDQDIKVVGIPKTIDNDIAMTDHSPGYGSAARFIAASTQEVGEDVKSLPIHVCIMEAMGRNAGWITAASALARRKQGDAPHLIYLPERNFNEDEFLEDVSKLQKKQGGVVVLVSEGLHDANGESIVPPIFKSERAVYYGDVSSHLANLVVKKLGVKARSEKPGLCGRASVALQSPVDREEARNTKSNSCQNKRGCCRENNFHKNISVFCAKDSGCLYQGIINVSYALINCNCHNQECCDPDNNNLRFSTYTCCNNYQRYICQRWDITNKLNPWFQNSSDRQVPCHKKCNRYCGYKAECKSGQD